MGAEARCSLCGAGRGRALRLSEEALAKLVPSGIAFARAALDAALRACLALGAAERGALQADTAALEACVREGTRAAAAQLVPASRLASATLELLPCAEPTLADPVLGRVRMEVDPCAAGGGAGEAEARQFSLSLTGAAAEGLPHNYGLRRLTDVMASHVFSEPAQAGQPPQQPLSLQLPRGASVAVEGLVERKFDMHLTDAGDAEYRRLSKARTAAASSKTRFVQDVTTIQTLGAPSDSGIVRRGLTTHEAGPKMVPLPRKANKPAPAAGAARSSVTRNDDELDALLFDLFERRSHWKVAEIVSVTGESMARLRPALARITEMDRRPGPLRGSYQLLAHLRKQE